MTQQAATAPVPAPPPGAPASVPGGAPSSPAARQQDAHTEFVRTDTPRLLNRLQVLAVVACLVFGVLAALLQVLGWQANGRAADNTEQVVRVQEIKSQLLRADAVATTGYLVGGLEPTEARTAYDAAIGTVLRLITEAAEAQPADQQALAALAGRVNEYNTAVTQARDYNRQGLPIGIAYLNEASAALRVTDDVDARSDYSAVAICDSLVAANTERARDEMGSHHPLLILGLGVLALAGLFLVNRRLAQRFRRRFNVGLVVAAAILAVLTLMNSLYAGSRNSANDETREGPYRTAVDEALARASANDAKATESQGLVNRGSGATFEERFDALAAQVRRTASPRTLRLWQAYVEQHDAVRTLDDEGDWDGARDLATSTKPDDPTALLDEVDASAAETTDNAAADATDEFRSGSITSIGLIALTLLGSLAAAGAVAWGINQRRREYA